MCKRIHLTALLLPLLLMLATGGQAQQTFSLTYQDYHPDTLMVEVYLDAVSPQPSFPDANTRMAYDTANLVYVGHITEGMIFGAWPVAYTTSPDSVLVRCNPITGACIGEANYVGNNMPNTTYLQGPGLAMLIKFAYKAGYAYDSRETWMTICSTRAGSSSPFVYYYPEAPVPLEPIGGAQIIFGPVFTWSETAGPVGKYTLEYSTSPTFASGVVTVADIPTDPPSESWSPGTDLAPGTYYWRVTAFDHIGRPSPVSAVDSFVVLACPEAPDSPETSANPVCTESEYCLSWDHVDNTAWYDIQLNGGPWDSIGYVDEICYTQSVAGDYEYRLRARKSGCPASDPSDPLMVTVESPMEEPEAPIVVQNPPFCAPASFTLQWDIDPQATRYEFREGSGAWVNIGLADQRAVTKNDPGVYSFHIRACNPVCGCTEPSDPIEVVVFGTPQAPVVSGPGSACVSAEYCLYWPSDPMAQNYHISTDGGATWPHGTSDTFFCATASDAGSATYQVRACNSCGGCGDASNSIVVTHDQRPEVIDFTICEWDPDEDTAHLVWPAVSDADIYRLYHNDTIMLSTTDTEASFDLPEDQDNIFMVTAVNACGEGQFPNVPSCVILRSDVHSHSYELLPSRYSLGQNYPNPFNPETYIDFALPRASHVTFTVYNMLGQQVRTLVDERLSAGPKTVTWDGTDDHGRTVSSGIYFYRLQAVDFQETRKMVLMK